MNYSDEPVATIDISSVLSSDDLQLAILKTDPVKNKLVIGKIYRYDCNYNTKQEYFMK